jgi:hypothetical protein
VKVNVEDILTTVLAVVLANRNAISRAHGLHCCRDPRKCRHQRACEIAVNVLDLCHVPDGHDEHMAPVTRLLAAAREHGRLAVAKRHNTRRELTPQNATEHARRCCFHGHRFLAPGFRLASELESVGLTSDGAEYIFHETEGRYSRLQTVLVDQGYKSWLVEFVKRWFGIIVDIVKRSSEQREFVVQPQRWKIERTFGWLDWSRILSAVNPQPR